MSSQDTQAATSVSQTLLPGQHPPSERRGRMRHPLVVSATVRLRGPGLAESPTRILDLSEDGIGLETSTSLPVDRTLALDLDLNPELNTERRLRVIGQVAWSQSTGRAGVRFFSPDHATLQEIQQWLFLNAVAEASQNARLPELLPLVSELASAGLGADGPHQELFLDEESGEPTAALSPLDRDTNAIVSRALALTGAKGAALALYEGGQLICRAICGTDTPALGARISTESGITGECVRLARVMYCSDSSTDSRVDREVCADLGIRSILALPLFAGERVVGLLEVLSQRAGAFDPIDAKALDQLARPVMGVLFAESNSESLHRGVHEVTNPAAEVSGPGESTSYLDLVSLERQRYALAHASQPRSRLPRRLLEGAAAVVVIAAVTWLVLWQTRTLAALKQPPPPVAASIPAQVPHVDPVPVAPESLADLKAAAQEGDPQKQYAVGAKYAAGEGLPQDYALAARWFTRAANNGYAPAQGMLGAYYWSGRGVRKDLKQAYFWSVLAWDGKDEISKDRVDALVARLSRPEMLDVQQRLRDWYRKHAADSSSSAVSSTPTH